MTYKIIRMYYDSDRAPKNRTLKTGITLKEAQAWCHDPETSSKTCKLPINKTRTKKYGPWFDCYNEE